MYGITFTWHNVVLSYWPYSQFSSFVCIFFTCVCVLCGQIYCTAHTTHIYRVYFRINLYLIHHQRHRTIVHCAVPNLSKQISPSTPTNLIVFINFVLVHITYKQYKKNDRKNINIFAPEFIRIISFVRAPFKRNRKEKNIWKIVCNSSFLWISIISFIRMHL